MRKIVSEISGEKEKVSAGNWNYSLKKLEL